VRRSSISDLRCSPPPVWLHDRLSHSEAVMIDCMMACDVVHRAIDSFLWFAEFHL